MNIRKIVAICWFVLMALSFLTAAIYITATDIQAAKAIGSVLLGVLSLLGLIFTTIWAAETLSDK